MDFLRKYGFYFLLSGVVSDFLTPYVLGIFYPKLNQMTAVISLFGDVGSPVRKAFLIWSVISGCLYVLAMPALYQAFVTTSKPLALLVTAAIGLYGVTDCIFTGLFSVDTNETSWNFSTWIHNLGSGIGYGGFILFPLFVSQNGRCAINSIVFYFTSCQLGFCRNLWRSTYSRIKSIAGFESVRFLSTDQFLL